MSIVDLVAAVTRGFPPVRGAGVIANTLRRLAMSLGTPDTRRVLRWEDTVWQLDLREITEAAVYFFPQLYNRRELRFLHSVTPTGGTFVDLGANIGFYSIIMARSVGPTGRCLAIEADPDSVATLRDAIQANQLEWVSVSETAISDREGMTSFEIRVDGNRGGSGIVAGNGPRSTRSRVIEVQTQTLLSVLTDRGIAAIDSMKVDLEGHEEAVFNAFFAEAPTDIWPRHLVVEYLSDGETERPLHALLARAGYAEKGRTSENLFLSLGRS